MTPVPFNRPSITQLERRYVGEALGAERLSGDGPYTERCHRLLETRYGFPRALLTTSGTDALELAALLLGIAPGDEVIVPAYTFVSSANAFALRGARIVFADSGPDSPNVDPREVETLLTSRTRAIVVVHYAGIACELDRLGAVAAEAGVPLVEDAAQALGASWRGQPLGRFGRCAAFSFHDTKNLTCGEGGMLAVNDAADVRRAEVIREKGTNRAAFFRGEIDRYGWVELGSSFLPSDLNAALLLAQLERADEIQATRCRLFETYRTSLAPLLAEEIGLPEVPAPCTGNGHAFYLVLRSLEERTALIAFLRQRGIQAAFHYCSLHRSEYFRGRHDGRELPHSDRYSDCLLRLPLYYGLGESEQAFVIESVLDWTGARRPLMRA